MNLRATPVRELPSARGEADAGAGSGVPLVTRLARALGLAAIESTSMGLATWAALSRKVMPSTCATTISRAGLGGTRCSTWRRASAWRRSPSLQSSSGGGVRACRCSSGWRAVCPRSALRALVPFLLDCRLWDGWDLVFLPLVAAFGWGLYAAISRRLEHAAGPRPLRRALREVAPVPGAARACPRCALAPRPAPRRGRRRRLRVRVLLLRRHDQ